MKRVLLAGGFGKMGQAIQAQLAQTEDLELVGILAPHPQAADVPVFENLVEIDVAADVWIDVTTPSTVFENVEFALAHGMDAVIGTSGLAEDELEALKQRAKQHTQHVLVVPNFSISAVLLMHFAEQAARYMPDAEVLEIHHQAKLDSPSGTAKATAQRIAKGRAAQPNLVGIGQASRGEAIEDVPVHAMRLPGYIAHEEVIFGATGESLHISQDSISRDSFMAGVVLALREVDQVPDLAVGLDTIMDF
ncbi:4-hydroxy-tetrahydrodipicolinate reductase [Weissella minor]|uniref:4-hydroxy-tetrahydrodipicolinate reductase n=1 Tax=Weissella minor TaxID=1620 RepID=UPI003AF28B0C